MRSLPQRLAALSLTLGLAVASVSAVAGPFDTALVKNINLNTGPSSLNPQNLTAVGTKVFFTTATTAEGEELWVSDGTLVGTKLVKDIRPGVVGSNIHSIVANGTKVFFSADDGVNGQELWVSDGTANGTQLVVNLRQDESSAEPGSLFALGKGVAFVARSDTRNLLTLWWTDGTPLNTRSLVQVTGEYQRSSTDFQENWKVVGTYLYFVTESEEARVLYKTNGTTAGTIALKTFTNELPEPKVLGFVGTTVYFSASTVADYGRDLWKTNGTAAGTVVVKPSTAGNNFDPGPVVAVDGKGYFLATTAENGREVWETTGTLAGTTLAFELTTGPIHSQFSDLLPLGKTLLVVGSSTEGRNGGLWAYTPKTKTNALVYDSGALGGLGVAVSNGTQAFFAVHGPEASWIYATKGTVLTTLKVGAESVTEGYNLAENLELVAAGPQVYFNAAKDGTESLWKSSGTTTEAGTALVKAGPINELGSNPVNFASVNGKLLFSANNGVNGRELWISNGTDEGTLLKDINVGSASSNPNSFFTTGEDNEQVAYFVATDAENGTELWITDGTPDGTQLLKNISTETDSGFEGSSKTEFVSYNGKVYFAAFDADHGSELWSTDGTPSGTVVMDQVVGNGSTYPSTLTVNAGLLYFKSGAVGNQKLVSYDGTTFTDVSSTFDSIGEMTTITAESVSKLLFLAKNISGTNPYRLHSVHPTTQAVTEIRTMNNAIEMPKNFRSLSGIVVFQSSQPNNTTYFWTTDGNSFQTGIGTAVAEYRSYPMELGPVVGDRIFYTKLESGYTQLMSAYYYRNGYDQMLLSAYGPAGTEGSLDFHQTVGNTVFFSTQEGDLKTLFAIQSIDFISDGEQDVKQTLTQIPGVTLAANTDVGVLAIGDRIYLSGKGATVGQELFVIDTATAELESKVILGTYSNDPAIPVAGMETIVQFPTTTPLPESTVTYTLSLKNLGLGSLNNISVSAPESDAFTLSDFTGTIAGGEEKAITLTFAPATAGAKELIVTISQNEEPLHTVKLRGTAVAELDKPVVKIEEEVVIRNTGNSFSLHANAVSTAAITKYVWKLGTKVVLTSQGESITSEFNVASPKLTDAGLYTVTATNANGSTTSANAYVVVAQSIPNSTLTLPGKTVTLTAAVTAPKGGTLSYQWALYETKLQDTDNIRGTKTNKLTISGFTPQDANYYVCVVTYTLNGKAYSYWAVSTSISIMTAPWVEAPSNVSSYVGEVIVDAAPDQSSGSAAGTSFKATGLPAGLKINATTGKISGTVTAALGLDTEGMNKPYKVIYTVTNAASSATASFDWMVTPVLPANTYEGILARNADTDDDLNLGSYVKLTTTVTGSLTGSLIHGGKTYALKGILKDVQPPEMMMGPKGIIEITVKGKSSPMILEVSANFFGTSARLIVPPNTGVVGENAETSGPLLPAAFSTAQPATAYEGSYTWKIAQVIQSEEPEEFGTITPTLVQPSLAPPGIGYSTATVSKTGIVTWTGKMADGSIITGSNTLGVGFMSTSPSFALHVDLYKATGSVQGNVSLVKPPSEVSESPVPVDPTHLDVNVSGNLDWNKKASTVSSEYNHKGGFGMDTPLSLSVSGKGYSAPASGQTMFGLTSTTTDPVTVNVDLIHSDWEAAIESSFKLSSLNKISGEILPATDVKGSIKTLTFTAKTGLYKGTILFPNTDTKLNRTVGFEGVVIKGSTQSQGFFLLPSLNGVTTSAMLKIAPIYSGQITFDAFIND
ncbi:ELWxxDGT repeat protein [Prosthecobacter fusiformis]|uniref:ELWxxDGT repeat protein n=1 Tax=Prosthecobacter fusiformis TaxID=48464 RepID=A0A4V3FFG6_9BACT|nr:putative Ig domain-containing protein [Prosthecobacter fusiformis]TDU70743.1 ELWxxDGT repeat protein [Prosthecobacter fusiformis]